MVVVLCTPLAIASGCAVVIDGVYMHLCAFAWHVHGACLVCVFMVCCVCVFLFTYYVCPAVARGLQSHRYIL